MSRAGLFDSIFVLIVVSFSSLRLDLFEISSLIKASRLAIRSACAANSFC